MRLLLSGLLLGGLALGLLAGEARAQDRKVFTYDYEVRDLPNGLRVVVVPTDFPNIVSLYIPVSVGSRHEVEPGKSGFAHFFEHMMFRGTENVSETEYKSRLQAAGADQNAYTDNDHTVYHITFTRDDLEEVVALEADRFQNLSYSEAVFRTEALAVLGEYNKNSANPVQKLFEVQRGAAFREHTYRHTTMGFIEDIEVMPDQMAYSRTFFDRFYRPEYTTVLVVGDVDPAETFRLVEHYWGSWERGSYTAEIPREPAPEGPAYTHVPWDAPTLPWVAVSFHTPAAYGAHDADVRALDVLGSYAFGSASDLYRRLVVEERKVDALWSYNPDRVDPFLMTVAARLRNAEDAAYVRDAIQQAIAEVRHRGVDTDRLDAIKSNLRYGFAHTLDNSPAIAGALATYLANTREVETINEVYARYDALTAADVQAAANRYLTDERMVVLTLAHGDLPAEARAAGSVDRHLAGASAAPAGGGPSASGTARSEASEASAPRGPNPGATGPSQAARLFETYRYETRSPLVDFRFLFTTGAASDPQGKEGLAQLTAWMVADAGSRELPYAELRRALFPMAAGFGVQVDKEMTVFVGRAHRDNAERYYGIVSGQLLDPGFRQEDFERVRTNLVNYVRVGLRANNDEELGKEVLYEVLYAGHPYGHLTAGHVAALEALTLDDVRDFYRRNYTQRNLTLGLGGDVPEALVARIEGDLAAALPAGEVTRQAPITGARMPEGTEVTLVQKDTRATAISMGFPIEVTRSHPDWVALWLVRSYLGEHRSSNSYLYQRMRALRGMNYGDYAYIEYFPRGMFQFHPDTNLGRHSQIFQVWVRPVPPEQAHFAIRVVRYELDNLVRDGLTEEAFEATRDYLSKFVAVLTQSQFRQLGYGLDARFYGTPEFTEFVRKGLQALTLDEVNRVIREHLRPENLAIVAVAPDAERLAEALATDAPSPMTYNAEMPEEVLAEDRVIERYPLGISPEAIRIVPETEVFERRVFARD